MKNYSIILLKDSSNGVHQYHFGGKFIFFLLVLFLIGAASLSWIYFDQYLKISNQQQLLEKQELAKTAYQKDTRRAYWRENLTIMAILLSVWFIVSLMLSVVFVDELNDIRLGGLRLGFWIAQQGSLYTFVVLIFIYVWTMNRLARKYGLEEENKDETTGKDDE